MKKKLAAALEIFIFAYLLGLLTIVYQLPPYSLLKVAYHIVHTGVKSTDVNYLDSRHFIHAVSEYDKLKYSPVTTHEELANRINEFMVSIDSFENAYNRIEFYHHQ